jgi:predicted unusual protein kinase regulating ubiquinone biosynthesis (AarF/ABC1/UbiB family)
MKISADHLKRYQQIARLLWKYGRRDLVQQMNAAQGLESDGEAVALISDDAVPEELADDLEAMGPTYIKMGQLLSSRPDLLPPPYIKALCRLQDSVAAFSYEEVERIITENLGARISKLFSRFDAEPIAAASLGQVHTAALRDGRPVVVKVQRPGIREQIAQDFEVLNAIALLLDEHTEIGKRYRIRVQLEEFRLTLAQELDYEREAQNLIAMGRNLEQFERICVPQPVLDYTTHCVLTMEQVAGRKITAVSPLTMIEVPGASLLDELFRAYLKQILVDGIFHADPHPGNVFLTDDGRIALLDLGMVGHTTPAMQENLLKLLLAISEGKSEHAAEMMIRIGQRASNWNAAEFRRKLIQLLALRQDQQLSRINVGRSVLQLALIAAENGLFVPSELTLLGKTLLQLDEIGKVLDPHFDPNEAIRRDVAALMSQRMLRDATQGSALGSALELKGFLSTLPSRLDRTLDAVNNGELEVRVKSVDAQMVVEGIEKIANRIAAGIVLAALIVGAALLMRVETTWRILGYPGLAMLFFLAAGAGGFWLVISTFIKDSKTAKKKP